jgi:hypothetical protein
VLGLRRGLEKRFIPSLFSFPFDPSLSSAILSHRNPGKKSRATVKMFFSIAGFFVLYVGKRLNFSHVFVCLDPEIRHILIISPIFWHICNNNRDCVRCESGKGNSIVGFIEGFQN